MIIGKIIGKTSTITFNFLVSKEVRKFDYIQIPHKEHDYVLCQITELEKEKDRTIAKCNVIGFKDKEGRVRQIRTPFEPGLEVLEAEDNFISEIIQLKKDKDGAYVGLLEGRGIEVYLDLKKLLTKHVAILAKSGAGKSYTVGVLLEEIMERKVPLLIIDPHGEYASMKQENDDEKDLESMKKFGIKPRGYSKIIEEYGDNTLNNNARPLRLNENLNIEELAHILPMKLSGAQLGVLYSAAKSFDKLTFSELLLNLEQEESNAKWNVINVVEFLNKTNLFSTSPTPYEELIRGGKCSIINLKGVPPEVQEIIVYKLMKDLFEARKKNQIPPFFAVIEEAHNYCPERSFGEKKCSSIIRTIASEGRKFGLGLCVISQRPARVEKSVLSQITTQIILKVTNPNDLKAISNSVEGITLESENEIKNLPIGSAMITGIVDLPLLVNIRTRKSKHGGATVDILKQKDEEDNFFDELKEFENKEILPIIKPKTSIKDLKLMSDKKIEKVEILLIPCVLTTCKQANQEFNILTDLVNGLIIKDIDNRKAAHLKKENLQPFYDKITFEEIPYTTKHEKKIELEEMKSLLKEMVNVIDMKECYIVYYQIS